MATVSLGFFVGPLKLLGASYVGYLTVDALAVLVLIVVFGERIARGKPLFAASSLSIPVLLFGVYCILEVGNPQAPFIRSVLGLRSWLLYLGFYFVGLYGLRSLSQVSRLYSILIILGTLTAGYGVYQWRAGPQAFATWSDYYGQYATWFHWSAGSGLVFRAFSTFVTPAAFASTLSILMLLAVAVVASPSIPRYCRVISGAAFSLMGAGLAASGSRGPVAFLILCGAAALVLVRGFGRRLRYLSMSVVVVSLAGVAITWLVGSVVRERFTTILDPQAFFWKWFGPLTAGLKIAWVHPFGMGLGYTAGVPRFIADPAIRDLPTINIDSGYGSAAAELGVVGLGLFVFLAVRLGLEGFRVWRSLAGGQLRDLLIGPSLLCVTYPIVSVVFQPQAVLPTSIIQWLLVGILMKAPQLQKGLDAGRLLRSEMQPRE